MDELNESLSSEGGGGESAPESEDSPEEVAAQIKICREDMATIAVDMQPLLRGNPRAMRTAMLHFKRGAGAPMELSCLVVKVGEYEEVKVNERGKPEERSWEYVFTTHYPGEGPDNSDHPQITAQYGFELPIPITKLSQEQRGHALEVIVTAFEQVNTMAHLTRTQTLPPAQEAS